MLITGLASATIAKTKDKIIKIERTLGLKPLFLERIFFKILGAKIFSNGDEPLFIISAIGTIKISKNRTSGFKKLILHPLNFYTQTAPKVATSQVLAGIENSNLF